MTQRRARLARERIRRAARTGSRDRRHLHRLQGPAPARPRSAARRWSAPRAALGPLLGLDAERRRERARRRAAQGRPVPGRRAPTCCPRPTSSGSRGCRTARARSPTPTCVGCSCEELGAQPEELFARIWRRPIASASLAQVHRATLHDGREVALKVQRPDVRAALSADLGDAARWRCARSRASRGRSASRSCSTSSSSRSSASSTSALEAESAERMAANFAGDAARAHPVRRARVHARRACS